MTIKGSTTDVNRNCGELSVNPYKSEILHNHIDKLRSILDAGIKKIWLELLSELLRNCV